MQWDAMGVQVQGQCISNVSSWYSAVNPVVFLPDVQYHAPFAYWAKF